MSILLLTTFKVSRSLKVFKGNIQSVWQVDLKSITCHCDVEDEVAPEIEGGPSFLLADTTSELERALEKDLEELCLEGKGRKEKERERKEDKEEGPGIEEVSWGEVMAEAEKTEEWVTLVEEDP